MDKFRYLHDLETIKEKLLSKTDYQMFHLVDEIHLNFVSLKGDFITVKNDEDEKQIFSLSHMYNKRAIKPDNDIFIAEKMGEHDDALKHDPTKPIRNYESFINTLKLYGFDGFYQIMSVDSLLMSLKRNVFLCSRYKNEPGLDMNQVYLDKTSKQDNQIHFKENIANFVALHYRSKNDNLLANYHILVRQKLNKVLVRFKPELLVDETKKCYPLPNGGLDLIYDQHFYQLNLTKDNYSLYHFEKYDYVAMFSSYDNHRHSTMVRTANVLVFDKLSIKWIDAFIFENENDKNEFLNHEKLDHPVLEKHQIKLIVDQTQFY
jgi:hypothetical protein